MNRYLRFLKCLQRLTEKPLYIGGAIRLMGFFWSSMIQEPRPGIPRIYCIPEG